MPIKRRTDLHTISDYSDGPPKQPWFKNLADPAPKKPLPLPAILPARSTTTVVPASVVRMAGALFANDEARREGHAFNVADQLLAVRTPDNPGELGDVRAHARIKNRATAITAICYDCQGGSRRQVTECYCVNCPLWAFRFGTDPMRGKR